MIYFHAGICRRKAGDLVTSLRLFVSGYLSGNDIYDLQIRFDDGV